MVMYISTTCNVHCTEYKMCNHVNDIDYLSAIRNTVSLFPMLLSPCNIIITSTHLDAEWLTARLSKQHYHLRTTCWTTKVTWNNSAHYCIDTTVWPTASLTMSRHCFWSLDWVLTHAFHLVCLTFVIQLNRMKVIERYHRCWELACYNIIGDGQDAILSIEGQHETRISCCDYRRTSVTEDAHLQLQWHIGDVICDLSHQCMTWVAIWPHESHKSTRRTCP